MARQHQFRGRFYDRSGTASVKTRVASLLILCALSAWGELPDRTRQRLDQMIAAARTAFETPSVSVAVAQSGNIVYARAFGNADTNTRYAIGSISKQFTVVALLLAQ